VTKTAWTLEGELNLLASQGDLADSLRVLGLIGSGDAVASLETVSDWHRSGAETYGLHFAVVTRSGQRREYFMKACVAFPVGISLAEIFAEWLSRRLVVQELGIGTPRLYGSGAATLVEEYIAYPLAEAFAFTPDRESLLRAVAATAARLVNGGFGPLSAHDWRSRGDDVVLVDFGQDLGPAHVAHGCESGLLSEVLDNLTRAGAALRPDELRLVGTVYEGLLPG